MARGRWASETSRVLEREEGPRLWRDRRGPLATPVLIVAVPRRWVGPMLRAGVGPSLVGGDALPGVRWRAGLVGWLSAAGAGRPGEVPAAGPAGALPGVRAHARAVAGVFARAPVGRGRRGRVRARDGGRGPRVSADRGRAGVAGDDGAWVAAAAARAGGCAARLVRRLWRSSWPSRRPRAPPGLLGARAVGAGDRRCVLGGPVAAGAGRGQRAACGRSARRRRPGGLLANTSGL